MALKILKSGQTPAPSDPVTDHTPAQGNPETPPTARADIRKKILPVAGAVAALAAVWMGGDWLLNGRFEIRTDNAHVRADISTVAAKIQGYVKTIDVADNQPVKAGDILFTVEDSDFRVRAAEAQAALSQAEAKVAAQQAAIQAAVGRAASQRDLLTEARAGAEAAAANAELSASDAKRLAELAEQGWYPRARVETATTQERATRAQQAQADAAVTANRSQVASSDSAVTQARQELAAAEAAVEAARARLEAANLDLGRTQIRAPIDGIVANRVVAAGQLVSPGQITMSIVPAADAYVIANFKETQVARMEAGQPVELHVDAYPNLKVHGRVESLSPATGATFSVMPQDTATGNFTKIVQRVPVRIAIDQEALDTGLLRSGLAVVATVSTKPRGE